MFKIISPRILEKKNIFKQKLKTPKKLLRDIFLITSLIFIGILISKGCYFIFPIFPHPSYLLNFIFTMFFLLSFFSGMMISINEFFLSKDVNFLLSTPISFLNFYFGKIILITFDAIWMSFLILIPIFISFKNYYGLNFNFYFTSLSLTLIFFCIPIFISNILIFFLSKIISLKIFKEILFFFYIGLFLGLGLLVKKIFIFKYQKDTLLNDLISNEPSNFLPSHWISNYLGNYNLEINPFSENIYYIIFTSLFSFLISFLLFKKNYFSVFDSISSFSSSKVIFIKWSEKFWEWISKFLGSKKQGILFKEYKNFFRTTSQTSQIFFLLGIIYIYFTNLSIVNIVNNSKTNLGLLIILNSAMCAFILIAFSSRFIYPAISLEAKAYDIYLASPTTLKTLLSVKKLFLGSLLSIISATIFSTSAMVLNLSVFNIILAFCFGIILSFGFVNISFITGTIFLNLNWKNPFELSSSLGSLCTMFFCIAYLVLIYFLYFFFKHTSFMNFYHLKDVFFLLFLIILTFILSSLTSKFCEKKLQKNLIL